MARIETIHKALHGGVVKYRIELMPNYSFDFNGSQVTFCETIRDVYDCLQHIVFCDGETIRR